MPRRNVRANKARKGGRNSREFDEWVASRMAPTIRPNPPPPHPLPPPLHPPPPQPTPPPTPLGVFRSVPDAIMRLLFTFFSMSDMFFRVETLSTQFKKYVPEYRREVVIITTSGSKAKNIVCLNVKVTRNTFFPPAISLADRNAWNISLGAMIVSKQLEYARENAYMRDKRIPLREDAIALSGIRTSRYI